MTKISPFIQKYRFWIDLLAVIVLGQIILWNAVPTALQLPNYKIIQPPESLSVPQSVPLNEFYMRGGFWQFNSQELYQSPTKMEYFGDNHLLIPIYRAVKTGEHLSNLGYNEVGFNINVKEVNTENSMIYKSLFSSTWNNMARLVYHFIPKHLKHITTPEQELELTKYITKVRYILAYIHLIGMLLFFIVLYKKLGYMYAYAYVVVLMLNPGVYFTATNLYNVVLLPMYLLAYTVCFSPWLIKNYSHKKLAFYTLGFTVLNGFFSYFGSLYYLIYTWAPAIATMFFIELFYLYHKNSFTNIKAISYSILRVLLVTCISLVPSVLISISEVKEMIMLYGAEAIEILNNRADANFMQTVYLGGDGIQKIDTIGKFLQHLIQYYITVSKQFATIPALWIERVMPKLLVFFPIILLRLKVLYLLGLYIIYALFNLYKYKVRMIPVIVYSGLAFFCFIIWTLELNIVSTVAAYHQSISGYVYSTYIDIIVALLVTKIIILSKHRKEQV